MTPRIILSLTFILLIFLIGCNKAPKKEKYSRTQTHLLNLLNDYKSLYFAEKDEKLKDKIQEEFSISLGNYLVNTLKRVVDSMTVTVDTVIQEGWLVTAKFHTVEIEFEYGIRFQDSMSSKFERQYNFMKNLKPKSEVTVNFIDIGGLQVNILGNNQIKTFRIFAYPEPASY